MSVSHTYIEREREVSSGVIDDREREREVSSGVIDDREREKSGSVIFWIICQVLCY